MTTPPHSSWSPTYDNPLSSEYGTCKTVNAKVWPWLQNKSSENVLSCSLYARKRIRQRGGLVSKARRLLYHSTLGLRVKKKAEEETTSPSERHVMFVLGAVCSFLEPVVPFRLRIAMSAVTELSTVMPCNARNPPKGPRCQP